jgi:hypothetical protein
MVTVGPALERRQVLLGRFVDIGVDLLAMAVTVSRAESRLRQDGRDRSPVELADHFCRAARRRIEEAFRNVSSNDDGTGVRLARGVLEGRYGWLEEGIIPACEEGATSRPQAVRGSPPSASMAEVAPTP